MGLTNRSFSQVPTIAEPKGRRTVLIVDYFFPPLAGSGVQRTLGYVRHLAEFGWTPIILTVRSGDSPFHDDSLLQRIPDGMIVSRARSLEPVRIAKGLFQDSGASKNMTAKRPSLVRKMARGLSGVEAWVLFPDRHIGWFPFALANGRDLCKRHSIDVIYSTSTAVTSHLVARHLSGVWRKPWIADFQDPFLDRDPPFPSAFHRGLARRLERIILQKADRVTVTTKPMREMFLREHQSIHPDKIAVITMGFDPDAFRGIVPLPRSKFTMTHFGNFYGRRSPVPLLVALGECVRESKGFARDAEVMLLGTFAPEWRNLTDSLLKQHHLERVVSLGGTVAYRTGLRHLVSSNVLLLVTEPGWTGQKLIPSKVYEYLAARRPVLALTPEGAAAEIIREANAGLVVPPDDIPAIRNAILALHQSWREGRLTSVVDQMVVKQFSWGALTSKFASILDDVVESRVVLGSLEGR